jgi:hypothetical protein
MTGDEWDTERYGRRWSLIGAGGAVVVVLVLAAFVLWPSSDDAGTDGAGTDTVTETGLPGATRLDGEIPAGFPHTEEGAIAAAAAWLPRLVTQPISLRPAGIEAVVLPEADVLLAGRDEGGDRERIWLAYDPFAIVNVETGGDGSVDLELAMITTQAFEDTGEVIISLEVDSLTMEWDSARDDWAIATVTDSRAVEPPFAYGELAEWDRLQPTGVIVGTPVAPRTSRSG